MLLQVSNHSNIINLPGPGNHVRMCQYTGTDWTMFPFSSQNPKDYRNLLAVYLDCVFHPLLKESDFNQEGWRLEHQDVSDKTTPLVFKGVVYNEMKGVFVSI